jgi:uncharacterized protein (DUF305 family)
MDHSEITPLGKPTMKLINLSITAMAAAVTLSLAAFAQDTEFKLPEQCVTSSGIGGMDHGSMDHGDDTTSDGVDLSTAPDHVQENMRRMMITMPAMEQGMMNEDPDVAFACGMIAHHQGAIDMARVLLEYGDDPEMIELAEEIMEAQVGEIEQMTNWLIENVN